MSGFAHYAFETLAWTGALIALVLVIRRPVARWFGPRFAYALWLLPALRLVLPPLTLPAWLDPVTSEPAAALPIDPAHVVLPVPLAATPAFEPDLFARMDLWTVLLAIWLGGAAMSLVLRFAGYARLRRAMTREAKVVEMRGRIVIIETPATDGPMAFGVVSPVVALPEGFRERTDPAAYALALEHELAHHRGGDCLANMAIQPLFALHWFTPLGRMGWLAFRRDQEAACDARVVEARSAEDKAAYADVIVQSAVHSASSPNPALAAAMACPVLGDTSIVHRIRSLTMQTPSRRRRATASVLLAGAMLALPATATISYARAAAVPPVESAALSIKPATTGFADVTAADEADGTDASASGTFEAQEEQAAPRSQDREAGTEATETVTIRIEDKDGLVTSDSSTKVLSPAEAEQRAARLQEQLAEMRKRLGDDGDFALSKDRIAELMARLERKEGALTRFRTIELSECKDKEGFCGLLSSATSQLATLKRARRSLEQQSELSREVRDNALRGLDEAIAALEKMKAG